jgi:DNA-binding transcriptional LysR family regulator
LLDLPKTFVPRIVANDLLFLCNAARTHAGIAMLPAFIADPHIATGELVRVLGTARVRAGGLVLLYPSSGQLARGSSGFQVAA